MLTRGQERALGYAACDAVLSTPELLENILSCLDMPMLLTTQRVSRRWRTTIKGSSNLQRFLFFQPIHQQEGELGERTQNPLLVELFTPWFISQKDFRYGAITALSMARNETRKAAFMRPSASWRRMLVSQPPVFTLGCWMTEYSVFGEIPGDWCWKFRILTFPQGLRMGKLYDLTQRWLYYNGAATSCAMYWTPHDPVTLTNFYWPQGIASEKMFKARDKCGAAVDLLLRAQRWLGRPGTGRSMWGRGGFMLKKLRGEEILGSASNYKKANSYKTVMEFADDLVATERHELERR